MTKAEKQQRIDDLKAWIYDIEVNHKLHPWSYNHPLFEDHAAMEDELKQLTSPTDEP